jgi:hypothetical protein
MTRLGDDSVGSFDHGRKSSVGTSVVPLTTVGGKAARGVQVKAAVSNTGTVYVGNSDVTADSADATDGFPLAPGDGLFLPIDDPTRVYLVASAAGQKVFFVVV